MKKLIYLPLIAMIGITHAGFNALTAHSRANCFKINESISWDATKAWHLATIASHNRPEPDEMKPNLFHFIDTWGKRPQHTTDYTKRSAVIHWKEIVYNNWKVQGHHFIKDIMKDGSIDYIKFKITEAIDCRIYDGWWGQDYPPKIREIS